MATASDASSRLHRILVVEDEEAVAEGLRLLLEQEYVVDLASSGQRALELLLEGGPFMEERLVFMTGGAFTAEAEAFLDEVSNARVEKPFDFASVDRLLRLAVSGRRS
jgi:response regulator RpfG family c-di-GMP phosphodiesterase